MQLSDWIPLSQAAEMLGYASTGTLRLYCLEGRIPGATKLGRNWVLPKSWIEEELKNPSLAPQGGRGTSRK